jgi:hypothetical protein
VAYSRNLRATKKTYNAWAQHRHTAHSNTTLSTTTAAAEHHNDVAGNAEPGLLLRCAHCKHSRPDCRARPRLCCQTQAAACHLAHSLSPTPLMHTARRPHAHDEQLSSVMPRGSGHFPCTHDSRLPTLVAFGNAYPSAPSRVSHHATQCFAWNAVCQQWQTSHLTAQVIHKPAFVSVYTGFLFKDTDKPMA